jgi:hypothetical protein
VVLATGRPTALEHALDRAARVAGSNRTCAVVAEENRLWWYSRLNALPRANVIVQPENRGTAVSILLPLLRIELRDPDSHLVLVPSRSITCDEDTLSRALELAGRESANPAGRILLVGGSREEHGDAGAGLVMAAHLRALLGLFERRFPELVDDLRCAVRHGLTYGSMDAVAEYYAGLPNIDVARHVLEGQASYLRQVDVPRRARRVPYTAGDILGLPTPYPTLQPAI